MGFCFWLLITIIAFAFLTFVRKWHDYALLFTVAIGFAVNANIYNASIVPVECGNLIFAIDSILYTGFMFTIIICAKEYGVRSAKILTSSTIAAILVSAVIEFMGKVSCFGFQSQYFTSLYYYIFSAIGTFLGVWFMLRIFETLEKKGVSVYLSFVLCVLIASIINSAIYYGLGMLVSGSMDNFIHVLLGSYIGKTISIVFGLVSYWVNTHLWIPNALKDKYKCILKKDSELQ